MTQKNQNTKTGAKRKSIFSAGLLGLTALLLLGGPVASAGTTAFEDFESGVPATWDEIETGSGSVTTDTAQAFNGAASLLSDPGSTPGRAVLERSDFVSSPRGILLVSFYDDMGGCTSSTAKKQMAWTLENAAYPSSVRGLGVSTDVSACTYSYRIDGLNLATAIQRTEGWHDFSFRWNGVSMVLEIDGVAVSVDLYNFEPDQVDVGHAWLDASGVAWYDDIVYAAR